MLLNAIFHSGIYTWLGLYFVRRYGMGEIGIGLALLGYGVPGFVLGPFIGRAADRWGRRWLLPAGLVVAALSVACLIFDVPPLAAGLAVTTLSLGYDMTQPLFAGIVTSLDPRRGGQAMGLNVFFLFSGCGLGSLFFGEALSMGFNLALAIFCIVQFGSGLIAAPRCFALKCLPLSPRRDWTCPSLMDTPKSAKVSAEGVNGGEGRKTEAAEVFSRVQGRDGAASTAQWQEHRPAGAGARDW